MRPRIVVSKKTLQKITGKVHYALEVGDMRIFKKAKAMLCILEGKRYSFISSELQVSLDTLRRWYNDFLQQGLNCFIYKTSPGRPDKLTKTQKRKLAEMLKSGPMANGYTSGCWKTPIIQDLICKKFGVFYSVKYLAEYLKNLGFSFQKAKFVSGHLDEEKRKEWKEKTWPKILELAKKKEGHILFGDEASFPQWGSLAYTWSPTGEQPIVKTSGKRRGFKVFGLISYNTGKFYHKEIEERFTSESYEQFLLEVLSKTRTHLIIIQDGAKYHTSKYMKNFFERHKNRITVFQMPSYSPDYNPIEMLWKKIKQTGVHLKYFPTFDDLKQVVSEMLIEFENTAEEVLSLFGLYNKLSTL